MNYEINFLVLQSKTAELQALREKTKKLIAQFGGEVIEVKEYAKRKLAYKIKKESYGFHTVFRFTLRKKENINELKKMLNLEEGIARYILVRTEGLLSLKELEEKLKKASEEKTHLSQEELGKFLLKDKEEDVTEKLKKIEEKPILNQEIKKKTKEISEKLKSKEKIPAEKTKKAPKEAKPANKEDKISMDELDKKLDEILNI